MFNFQIKKWARTSTLEDSCLSYTDYSVPPLPHRWSHKPSMSRGRHLFFLDAQHLNLVSWFLLVNHSSLRSFSTYASISKQYTLWFWGHSMCFISWLNSFSLHYVFRFTHCSFSAGVQVHGYTCFYLVSVVFGQCLCCPVIKYFENHHWIHSFDMYPVKYSIMWIYCILFIHSTTDKYLNVFIFLVL